MSKILEKLSKEDLLELVRKYRRAYFKELERETLKVGDVVSYYGKPAEIKQIFSCESHTTYYLLVNDMLTPINNTLPLHKYKDE